MKKTTDVIVDEAHSGFSFLGGRRWFGRRWRTRQGQQLTVSTSVRMMVQQE